MPPDTRRYSLQFWYISRSALSHISLASLEMLEKRSVFQFALSNVCLAQSSPEICEPDSLAGDLWHDCRASTFVRTMCCDSSFCCVSSFCDHRHDRSAAEMQSANWAPTVYQLITAVKFNLAVLLSHTQLGSIGLFFCFDVRAFHVPNNLCFSMVVLR